LATSQADVAAAERLRYQIFAEELGAQVGSGARDGRDHDEFDDDCEHLLVIDQDADWVVGCYRVLLPNAAKRRGGYYADTEFNLAPLEPLRSGLAEVGRACIHPSYRSGGVILMLWSALAQYLNTCHVPYVMGCASVPLNDGGFTASAVCRRLADSPIMPLEYRVVPHRPYPWRQVVAGIPKPFAKEPPLVKGYRHLGAWIHSDAAWDPHFNTADLFVLLPLQNIAGSYGRHFFGK
jgi:putative hemolysin